MALVVQAVHCLDTVWLVWKMKKRLENVFEDDGGRKNEAKAGEPEATEASSAAGGLFSTFSSRQPGPLQNSGAKNKFDSDHTSRGNIRGHSSLGAHS